MKYENTDGLPVVRHGLHWRMRKVEKVVDTVYRDFGQEGVMTSGVDREHSPWSWHYYGCAADFRTSFFTSDTAVIVARKLKELLREPYQVVLEPDHIHVEFDPVFYNM